MGVCLLACAVLATVIMMGSAPASAWMVGDSIPIGYQLKINSTAVFRTGKDIWTPLPADFGPRFGVDRHVLIPSADYIFDENRISIRFKLERGLEKMSKWILVKRTTPKMVASNIGGRHQKILSAERHLARVIFDFGYQSGGSTDAALNKITSLRIYARFSDVPQTTIALEYMWTEHRRYNPHQALTVAYVVSVVVVIAMVHRLLNSSILPLGRDGRVRKMVVVENK